MEIYAKYNYTTGYQATRIGTGWHRVTQEKVRRTPSGIHQYITINGISVKANHCEIVQVFIK